MLSFMVPFPSPALPERVQGPAVMVMRVDLGQSPPTMQEKGWDEVVSA